MNQSIDVAWEWDGEAVEAVNAIRLGPRGKKLYPTANDPAENALFHDNAFVWPEEES